MDTLCESHKQRSALEVGSTAAHPEKEKIKKYSLLGHCYLFQPVAFETLGTIGPESMPFLNDLRRRLKLVSGEPKSFVSLLQRLSVAIQVGNSTSVLGTLDNSWDLEGF